MTDQRDIRHLRAALDEVTPPVPHLSHRVQSALREAAAEPPASSRRGFALRAVGVGGLAVVLVGVLAISLAIRTHRAGNALPESVGLPASAARTTSPAPTGASGGLALPAVAGYDVGHQDSLSLGRVASATDVWIVQRHSPGFFAKPGETFGIAYHSTDGGKTWAQKLRFEGEYDRMWFSADGQNGAVWGVTERVPPCTRVSGDCSAAPPAAPGIVYRTTDGGEHWTSARTPEGLSLYEMDFVDDSQGWAILHAPVGTTLDVYATVDGGKTWQKRGTLTSPASVTVPAAFGSSRRLQFFDAQHGVFLPAPGATAVLMTTGDGGQTWQRVDLARPTGLPWQPGITVAGGPTILPNGTGLLPVWPAGPQTGSSVFVYTTTDHGRTWSNPRNMNVPASALSGSRVWAVTFLDSSHWWVSSEGPPQHQNGPTSPHVSVTADGGRTWTTVASPRVLDLMLAGPGVGWAEYQPWNSGLTNLALTQDQGTHWVALPLPPAVDR
jgi:photosystem II stability/assembly factor-like uncharacterized protein